MPPPSPLDQANRDRRRMPWLRVAAAALATAMIGVGAPALGPGPASAASAEAQALPAPQQGAEVYPRPADGVYDVTGGGFGHGIGMSQYGAHGAALKGLAHTQILAFYYPGTKLVQGGLTSIRVGLTTDNDGVLTIRARQGVTLTAGGATTTLPSGPTLWRVRATGTGAASCLVESYSTAWTAWSSGATPCPVSFASPEGSVDVLLPSGSTSIYRGAVAAVHTGSTRLSTVNTLPIQSYLRSVVPAEMPPSFSADALEAQAVAARTYASRRSNGTVYYDTCDTTACQVYRGSGRRNADGTRTSFEYASTDSAVEATSGRVLTYVSSDGVTRLATTMYSSSNGGQTVAASPSHPYLAARPDPYDGVSINARHAWTAQLPVASLESRFGIARVERVQILSRDGAGSWGGRVLTVLVEGTTSGGSYTSVSTTGNGIVGARPWPSFASGLSSAYFTIKAEGPAEVTRLAGPDRFATAAQISASWAPGVAVVYVATGMDFPDALAGVARAGFNGAPILLTLPDTVPTATSQAMTRLKPGRVVVLGGPSVVSDAVAESLRRMTTSLQVERVAGRDRYETAAKLAAYYPAGGPVAYVASGADFPDALAGSALAGRDKAPVVLTHPDVLPASTAAALDRLEPTRIVVLGGSGAVSDSVLAALRTHAGSGGVTRLSGSDRYGTSAAVASQYPTAAAVYVASGADFPDALAGAARAAAARVPVLLTPPTTLATPTRDQIRRMAPSRAFVLGGQSVVSDSVAAAIGSVLG